MTFVEWILFLVSAVIVAGVIFLGAVAALFWFGVMFMLLPILIAGVVGILMWLARRPA